MKTLIYGFFLFGEVMGYNLNFSNRSFFGYIESESLLSLTMRRIRGWICGNEAITKIMLVSKGTVFEGQIGIKREDVKTFFQNDTSIVFTSGYVIDFPNDKPEIIFFGQQSQEASIEIILSSGEKLSSNIFPIFTVTQEAFFSSAVPRSEKLIHPRWTEFLSAKYNKPDTEILEVGSRRVTGAQLENFFSKAHYTGFDIHPGENVDVVGDAHKLSTYFDKQFDLIFSSAVFEHLAMPWIVSREIIKLLKLSGSVFVETHYSFSSHERPWHFFQFSEQALKILFPRQFGIECIEAGVSNPIIGFFPPDVHPPLRNRRVRELYCHSEFLGIKVEEIENLSWETVNISALVEHTAYPVKKENS